MDAKIKAHRPSPAVLANIGSYFEETYICQFLHVILVLIYAAAVVVASQHYEHMLNFPFSSYGQSLMSLTVSTVAQTFSTVCIMTMCAVLLSGLIWPSFTLQFLSL